MTDAIIATHTAVARTVAPDTIRGDGDVIFAGQGRNLVFGDNGQISAAGRVAPRFGAHPITLGLVESIESLIGGSDEITVLDGDDIVIGGIDADTITAGAGQQPDRRRQRADRLDRSSSTAGRWPGMTSTRLTSTGSGRSIPITAAAT